MARRKIIVDTDPGVDDVLAILLALASPEVDVVALTITFGNTGAPLAYANALKVYAQIERELAHDPAAAARYVGLERGANGRKTILAKGAEEPIDGVVEFAAYFHGKDGLSNISETHPHFTPPELGDGDEHQHLEISRKAASEVILDILREEPAGSVTIVALGPLSNVALAIQADPEAFKRVGEVVWMGGALEVPGNTSSTAEFNSFADPYAAQIVLDQVATGAFPMVMCPLDITTPHSIPFSELIQDESTPPSSRSGTPLRKFTTAMLGRVRGVMKSFGLPDSMEMHDPLAVWYALTHAPGMALDQEQDGWRTVKRVFKVERVGELTRGMCVVDRRGTGEQSEPRTKSEALNGGGPTVAPPLPSGINGAPNVVVQTPGKKVLEELLLSRVYGEK